MRAEMALTCALLVVLTATLPVQAALGVQRAPAADGSSAPTPSAPSPRTAVGPSSLAEGPPAASLAGAATLQDGSIQEDGTVRIDIQLLESGDANWTVSTFVPLEDGSDREAFRELGRRYENETATLKMDAELFQRFVAASRSSSGRPMSIPEESVRRDWTIRNGTGVIVLQFTWTNFAREQGDRLIVDDAFETSEGTWLPGLEEGQTLVIRPPEGLGFLDAPTGVTNATLRWEGPQQFGQDYFRIVYRVDEDGETTTDTLTDTRTDSETPTDEPPSGLPAGLFVVLVLLGGGGAAAYFLVRRGRPGGDDEPGAPPAADDAGDGGPPPSAATDGSDVVGEPPSDGDPEPEEPPEPTPENPFVGVDVEMLSDEERVLRLLDANGGRMKQAQIVKETDWSNAKVSQLLSGMDDEDAIDKLRIGRENLISLPDVNVERFDE